MNALKNRTTTTKKTHHSYLIALTQNSVGFSEKHIFDNYSVLFTKYCTAHRLTPLKRNFK